GRQPVFLGRKGNWSQNQPALNSATLTSIALALAFGHPLALLGGERPRCQHLFFLPARDLSRRCRLPNHSGVIVTAGNNPLAIRGKGGIQHPMAMPLED